jgi:hypothetical protein
MAPKPLAAGLVRDSTRLAQRRNEGWPSGAALEFCVALWLASLDLVLPFRLASPQSREVPTQRALVGRQSKVSLARLVASAGSTLVLLGSASCADLWWLVPSSTPRYCTSVQAR